MKNSSLENRCNAVYKLVLVFVFSIMLSMGLDAAQPDAPSNLRSFDRTKPIGTNGHPYFGWYVNDPDDNEMQSAYQILIASSLDKLNKDEGDVWNSGKVSSRTQNYVYAEGVKLQPDTRYFWKVRTWDKDGNASPYADAALFETGLLSNTDWSGAKWIRRNTTVDDDYTYFRKKLTLPVKTIDRATVFISACHNYEIFINGTFIGKGFNYHYPQYGYYQAWDITPSLKNGSENVISCLTHWYGRGQGRAAGARGLLAKTMIHFTDGTVTVIGSDSSWKQAQAEQWVTGQPQRNGEGIGRVEMIDSRKFLPHWNAVDFTDASWENATEVGNHPVEPWTGILSADLPRVIEKEIKPASVVNLGSGKFVIDLGRIEAGSFKIAFEGGRAGDTVRMYGGYVLESDGSVNTKLNQQTNMKYSFILHGGKAVFHPHVYLGMRYLQIENSPNTLTSESVSFIRRHYEMNPARSAFSSSIPMLNSVWNLMSHSLVTGAHEGFVDTPTREKGAFLGDGWSQSVPALSVMYDRLLSQRSLSEFLTSQDQYWPDGRLNAVYPNGDGGRDIPDYTQSFLVWAWDYYMQTGNSVFLKVNYVRLKKIADYVDRYRNDTTGLIHRLAGGSGPYLYGIVDWPAGMRYGYDMAVDSRTVVDAYAYADFDIFSRIAEVTGNTSDKAVYRTKADAMQQAINARLINSDGVYIDGLNPDKSQSAHVSQHANIMPLALGIVPEKNYEKVVTEVKNRRMNVGMVCLRWLPEALGKAGQGDHLVELYTNSEWDGWAKTIELGGTVTWESWNANLVNESMSHPWGAVGLLGIQQFILGVQPLKPQHELVLVKPLEFEKLKNATGKYPTDKGDILVSWDNSGNTYLLKVTIPANVTANVCIPRFKGKDFNVVVNGKKVKGRADGNHLCIDGIGSGTHTFERIKKFPRNLLHKL